MQKNKTAKDKRVELSEREEVRLGHPGFVYLAVITDRNDGRDYKFFNEFTSLHDENIKHPTSGGVKRMQSACECERQETASWC